ncbi:MAG: TonB-dependent receptor [Spirochaetia bacterium]|nr:TonB-dependent receptor [Spirochaetia bacterium]
MKTSANLFLSFCRNLTFPFTGLIFLTVGNVFAQTPLFLEGTVYDLVTKKSLEFATVAVLETQEKLKTDINGNFKISFKNTGAYTIIISYTGMRPEKISLNISENISKEFFLKPISVYGGAITIKDEKERQKTGRQTLTNKKIKEIPGSMNDSISALNTLAGVERYGGIFGYLVMRGANSFYNRYSIDGITVVMPQHFLGIHSVFHNDFIEDIDVYASLYPVHLRGSAGPLIQINTIDNADTFGGSFELGILSANLMLTSPIREENENKEKTNGFWAAAGRIGYLSVLLPPIIKMVTGDDYSSIPDYYDYQTKVKYEFNHNHAITFLFFGAQDKWNIVSELNDEEKNKALEEGIDPFLLDLQTLQNFSFHTQSVKYSYIRHVKFENHLLLFLTFNKNERTMNVDNTNAVSWLKDWKITSNPNIYGIKNDTILRWMDKHFTLKTGVEINIYDFSASGKGFLPKETSSTGILALDMGNENLFQTYYIDVDTQNTITSGYIENEFKLGSFSFIPGIRTDYFIEAKTTAFNPRGIVSYLFETETEVSFGMGKYESFAHENANLFSAAPMIAELKDDITTEKTIQRTGGIEQKILADYSMKVEAYYNNYYDLGEGAYSNTNGIETFGQASGETKNYGFELTLKKDPSEENNTLYGWLSYTYNIGLHKTNLPLENDLYGDQWLNSEFSKKHIFKLVSGYAYNEHKIGARFQLYSSSPYTPIIGDDGDPNNTGRYSPVYGKRFSKYFPINHSLDVRYTKTKKYSWGSFSWYMEFLNIYNNQPLIMQDFKYNQPYKAGENPTMSAGPGPFFAGNFGMEIKF